MINRCFNINKAIENKSIFLLGPRQTGKSTLIKKILSNALYLSLLHAQTYRLLAKNPEILKDWVKAHLQSLSHLRDVNTPNKSHNHVVAVVAIDEIQKLPFLLDVVQELIEEHPHLRFVLTGSSARKLKKTGVNLLGGRARKYLLHPLTYNEFLPFANSQELQPFETLLQWGGLPSVVTAKSPKRELEDYGGLYLKEEIQAEAIVRSIGGFSRFIEVAALSNAEQILFSNIASDAEVPARTVREYFQVLEDTLVGKLLPAFQGTKTRKAMSAAKFYFFDVGLANALTYRFSLAKGTSEYGKAFEHLLWRELESAIHYFELDLEVQYWRSLSKLEVDFIIYSLEKKEPILAIEAKAKSIISERDLKGLLAFSEEFSQIKKLVVSLEPRKRTLENEIEIWPVEEFLKNLPDILLKQTTTNPTI